jgi:hypothetical protein
MFLAIIRESPPLLQYVNDAHRFRTTFGEVRAADDLFLKEKERKEKHAQAKLNLDLD